MRGASMGEGCIWGVAVYGEGNLLSRCCERRQSRPHYTQSEGYRLFNNSSAIHPTTIYSSPAISSDGIKYLMVIQIWQPSIIHIRFNVVILNS